MVAGGPPSGRDRARDGHEYVGGEACSARDDGGLPLDDRGWTGYVALVDARGLAEGGFRIDRRGADT